MALSPLVLIALVVLGLLVVYLVTTQLPAQWRLGAVIVLIVVLIVVMLWLLGMI